MSNPGENNFYSRGLKEVLTFNCMLSMLDGGFHINQGATCPAIRLSRSIVVAVIGQLHVQVTFLSLAKA